MLSFHLYQLSVLCQLCDTFGHSCGGHAGTSSEKPVMLSDWLLRQAGGVWLRYDDKFMAGVSSALTLQHLFSRIT